jgi:AraC-like DNA-binding protein
MVVPSGRDKRRALRVREYLLLHLAESITLEQTTLALRSSASTMSTSTIQRALHATWGIGFHELFERLRVQRFLTLLAADPDAKIEPLANTIGWRSKGNLYAAVRRVTGHSLSELRSDLVLLASTLAALQTDKPASVALIQARPETLAS